MLPLPLTLLASTQIRPITDGNLPLLSPQQSRSAQTTHKSEYVLDRGSIEASADNDLVLSRRHGEFSSKAFKLGTHLCSGSEAACILPVCCLNFGMNNI
jgi:hypothetical protein